MKKKIIYIVSVLWLLCNLFSIIVNAETNEIMSFRIEKIKDSKQIKVIMDVANFEKGALGLQGTLNFENEELELVEAKAKNENWRITALNKENGKFIVEISDEAFFDQEKYLYEEEGFIEFVFNDLKKLNTCDITVSDIKMVDSMYETVALDDVEINVKSFNWIIFISIICCFITILFFVRKNKNKK